MFICLFFLTKLRKQNEEVLETWSFLLACSLLYLKIGILVFSNSYSLYTLWTNLFPLHSQWFPFESVSFAIECFFGYAYIQKLVDQHPPCTKFIFCILPTHGSLILQVVYGDIVVVIVTIVFVRRCRTTILKSANASHLFCIQYPYFTLWICKAMYVMSHPRWLTIAL